MRRCLTTFLALIASLGSPAMADETAKSVWEVQRERQLYIQSTRPRRIDVPLREENISDIEIGEIQTVTADVFPGAIANISGVVEGCPCEEGTSCDAQVWVLAYKDGRYDGLLLSRIDDRWIVGPLQTWWRKYELLQRQLWEARSPRATRDRDAYQSYLTRYRRLQDNFPNCSS